MTNGPTDEITTAFDLLRGRLRWTGCGAMALLLDRALPGAAATMAALDVTWRDLANLAAVHGSLADALAESGHPRLAARAWHKRNLLESLSETAMALHQGDLVRLRRAIAEYATPNEMHRMAQARKHR